MADDLGPVAFGQEDEPIFIGKEIARHKDYSEETARRIDEAVHRILDACLERARVILETQKDKLQVLAEALIQRETLLDSDVRTRLGYPARESTVALEVKELKGRGNCKTICLLRYALLPFPLRGPLVSGSR